MSYHDNSREGLSPSPPNILDIFTEDEDDDDVDSYHPTEDRSTNASDLNDDDEDEDEDEDDDDTAFAGILIPRIQLTVYNGVLTVGFQMRRRP